MSNNFQRSPGKDGHPPSLAARDDPPDPDPNLNRVNHPPVDSPPGRSQNVPGGVRTQSTDGRITWAETAQGKNLEKAKKQKSAKKKVKTTAKGGGETQRSVSSEGASEESSDENCPAYSDEESRSEENSSMAEDDRDDEDLEEDINFLRNEGKLGLAERKAYHQANQFERMQTEAPQEILLTLLNEITYNPASVQYNVVNHFNMSNSQMMESFLSELESHVSETINDVRESATAMREVAERKKSFRENAAAFTMDEFQAMEARLTEENSIYGARYQAAVIKFFAFKGMEKIRIIQGKAHFPSVAQNSINAAWLAMIGNTADIGCESYKVKLKMDEVLIHTPVVSIDDPEKFFSFSKPTVTDGKLLYTSVDYIAIDEGVHAAEYYSKFFLAPSDKIIKFVAKHSASAKGRMEAHVLIELGSTKLPTRKKTVGASKAYFKHLAESDTTFDAQQIIDLTEQLARYEALSPNDESPEVKRYKTITKKSLAEHQKRQKVFVNMVRELESKPEYEVLDDPFDMTSRVVFNMEYCSMCNTTEHSFRNCTRRGCTICHHRNHPTKRCAFKCDCKKGRIHSIESCQELSTIRSVKQSDIDALHKAKHDNDAFRKKFLEQLKADKLQAAEIARTAEEELQEITATATQALPTTSTTAPSVASEETPTNNTPSSSGSALQSKHSPFNTTTNNSASANGNSTGRTPPGPQTGVPGPNPPQGSSSDAQSNRSSQEQTATPFPSMGITDSDLINLSRPRAEDVRMADPVGDTDIDDPQFDGSTRRSQISPSTLGDTKGRPLTAGTGYIRRNDSKQDEEMDSSEDTALSERDSQSQY